MKAFTRLALMLCILVGSVGCDQISKAAARAYLPGTGIHSYLGDTFRLQYAENHGAFLSFGASLSTATRYAIFTVGLGALVAALLLGSVFSRRLEWPQRLCIAIIGASGAANIIDRIRYDGAVTDFLNLGVGSLRTGIFNLADVTLILGVRGLLLAPQLLGSRNVRLK
jgi:signal peptidase II